MGCNRNKRQGRHVEREIAKCIDGNALGVLGGEDIKHPYFSVEVKSRAKLAIHPWFEQCLKNNKGSKIPLLICHQTGRRYMDSYCVLTLRDLKRVCPHLFPEPVRIPLPDPASLDPEVPTE